MQQFDFTENFKIVNVSPPIDAATGSLGLATEWISMKNAQKATWILNIGVNSASASTLILSLSVADDASGTHSATVASSSTTLSFPHLYTQTSGDTFAKTSCTNSAFVPVAATYDSCLIVAELEAGGTFVSSSVTYDAEYVRLVGTDPVGSALVSCICILSGIRYQQDSPPTAIT